MEKELTAMQKLLNYIETDFGWFLKHSPAHGVVPQMKTKATELLETEKQQIGDAHYDGQKCAGCKHPSGNDALAYFKATFNLSLPITPKEEITDKNPVGKKNIYVNGFIYECQDHNIAIIKGALYSPEFLSSLVCLKVIGKHSFAGYQQVEEGVDYIKQYQANDGIGWVNCSQKAHRILKDHYCRIVALPLTAIIKKEISEENDKQLFYLSELIRTVSRIVNKFPAAIYPSDIERLIQAQDILAKHANINTAEILTPSAPVTENTPKAPFDRLQCEKDLLLMFRGYDFPERIKSLVDYCENINISK